MICSKFSLETRRYLCRFYQILDEMIAKTLESKYAMYALYECDGLRYELNIMFSDDTAYTTVWVYDESDETHAH